MEIKNYLDVYKNYENYKAVEYICQKSKEREVVFLCVGNSKIWFDSFGPMVGSLLKIIGVNNFVYGNVYSNVIPTNIAYYIENIYKFHLNPYIVVIDSCISKNIDDCLIFKEDSLTCSSLNKNSINVGDFFITYTFNKEFVNDLKNYKKMLKKVKELISYFKLVFN